MIMDAGPTAQDKTSQRSTTSPTYHTARSMPGPIIGMSFQVCMWIDSQANVHLCMRTSQMQCFASLLAQ